jgi:hypothetical protein
MVSYLRAELRKYDIPIDDIPKFAKTVDGIREYGYGYGYGVGKVISEFSVSIARNTTLIEPSE